MDLLQIPEEDVVEYPEGSVVPVYRTLEVQDASFAWIPLTLAAITSLTLEKFYDGDAAVDDVASIINSRSAITIVTNGIVQAGGIAAGFSMHATSGLLTWQLVVADSPIKHPTQDSEVHVQLMRVVHTGGAFWDQVYHRVLNLRRVTGATSV